jgi:diguanylate cyclase (GGDEF)-like protein
MSAISFDLRKVTWVVGLSKVALPERALLYFLGTLCVLPALVPVVARKDDQLFLYPYLAVLNLLCIAFCLVLAARRKNAQRKRWALLSIYFGFSSLVYVFALSGVLHILSSAHFWIGGAAITAARMAILLAMTWAAGGPRRVKAMDACMTLLLPALVFVGSYTATYHSNAPSHLYTNFGCTLFLALVGTAAYFGNDVRSSTAFSYIAMIFLWASVIDLFFINLVNYQWLASPRQMPFDLMYGMTHLLFCWLANRALQHGDEPVARFRKPWMESLMPSLLALVGVIVAPLALREHPVLSAAFAVVMIALYVARTQLMYGRLMHTQKELRSDAGRFQHLATSDALTGIGNRRALQEVADRLLARTPVSAAALILLDVDHFKEINDAFGHSAGDDVLHLVADILLDAVSQIEGSCCTRLGGDEFVALLPDVSAAITQEMAEYVRRRVQAQCVQKDLPVTISVGTTVSAGVWTLTSLLKDADVALYRAKSRGRNLVMPSVDIAPMQTHYAN